MNWWILVIIFLSVIFDALRDAFWGTEKKIWHLFKWLSFYPPLAYISITEFGWHTIWIAVVSLAIWRFSVSYWGGKRTWKSFWFRFFFGKDFPH